MNPDSYRRESETRQDAERASAISGKHTTMETWQLEQHEAQTGATWDNSNSDQSGVDASPGLWGRIKRLFGGK
jgi:hypothetical protein